MRRKLDYGFLDCARKMPPLSHSREGAVDFRIEESDVVKYLISQPAILQKVFNMACNRKVIVYDRETEKWQGVDYHGD